MKHLRSGLPSVGLLIAILVTLPWSVGAQEAKPESAWEFNAEIYLWGASIGGKSGTGSDVDIDFDDLIKDLKMGFMGAGGARKGKWSFFADVLYLDVKGNESGLVRDITLKAWIVTPEVGYRVIENEKGFLDIVGGARYLYLKADVDLETRSLPNPITKRVTTSGNGWDGVAGLKGQLALGEKWYLPFYGDIGGGNAKLTWQVLAGIGYRFKKFDLIAAYRYLDWDFDDGEAFDDLNIGGPFFGFKFRF